MYSTSAKVGQQYTTDTGFVVVVEHCDDRFGTVRFTNGWLIAYSAFEDCYKPLKSDKAKRSKAKSVKLAVLLALLAVSGCSSKVPTFESQIEVGMTIAEVEAITGSGETLPNFFNDGRRITQYRDTDGTYCVVAFSDGKVEGAKASDVSIIPGTK